MPWNSGANDPTPGPWGPPGGRPNGGNRPPPNRGPWGGGGGGGGGGGPNNPLPDLDQLIAKVNAWFQGFVPGRSVRPGMPRAGGRGLILLVVLVAAVWLATG